MNVWWRWEAAKGVPFYLPMLEADRLISEVYTTC
jgi:hypothetical protein